VLHHPEAAQWGNLGLELTERAAVTFEESVEQQPSGRACDGCPTTRWHADPFAVWLDYAEQAAVGAEVGTWTIVRA
jgi:hypothetical protein